MNRRSVLSTLCTGALALLAPVAAWATGKRRVEPTSLLRDDWLEWDSFDRRNQMNDASGTGRYIAALERLATAAARIYNEGSVLSDAGRPTARFVRRNSREATLELEASLHDLRDNYPASVMRAYGRELPPVSDVSVLRALLAEARWHLDISGDVPTPPGCNDPRDDPHAYADDLNRFKDRLDAVLKGHEHV